MTNATRLMTPAAEPGDVFKTFSTHGKEIGVHDLEKMSKHARLSPADARAQLIATINKIPDSALKNYLAGQVTVIA